MAPLVVIPEPIGLKGLQLLRQQCRCVAPWLAEAAMDDLEASRPEALPELLCQAEAVIVRIFPLRGAELDRAEKLRVIAKHGVGLDNIDIEEATRRRIPVLYTPGSNANAVAEHTLGLLLSVARRLGPAEASLRDGWRRERSEFLGFELAGKTLGVVGLGRIGKRVALKAALGFGMRVLAYDPYIDHTDYPGPAILQTSLETLLAESDVLTLHVPLTTETRDLIDQDRLRQMKPTACLINTSRGAVVNESALAHALEHQEIAVAALDVFEREPLPPEHPLLRAPNLLLTPHIAGQTDAAMELASVMVAEGVLHALQGKRPQHLVNPETWE